MQKKMTNVLIGVLLCVGMVSTAIAGSVDWMQSKGTEIRFLMNKHPFTSYIEPKVAEFEKMTGIKVTLEVFPEDQFRNKRMIELNAGGTVDGYMIMPGGLGCQRLFRRPHEGIIHRGQTDRHRDQRRSFPSVLSQGPVRSF